MKKLFGGLLIGLMLATSTVQAAPPQQGNEGEIYVVQANDWLSKLALKYYGDVAAWPAIWLGTNTKAETDDAFAAIADPNIIEIGQQLWVPPQAKADQLLADYAPSSDTITDTTGEAATEMAESTSTVIAEVANSPSAAIEVSLTEIALAGPIAVRDSEISGLAWYGDYLILMPQYPNFAVKAGESEGFIFALSKADILAYLDGSNSDPLEPVQIPFSASGLSDQIENFEGYEALAFIGDTAYLTIESSPAAGMKGFLVSGTLASDLSALTLNADVRAVIEPQAAVSNHTDETLLVADDMLVTFYESIGAAVVPEPVAHRFDPALTPVDTIPTLNIEYRITDATALDSDNRFWVINYFFPGDQSLLPERDPIAETFGKGATHAEYDHVERLVELQYDSAGISLTDTAPLQLELIQAAHNWEGLVRLENRGFLIATDKWPDMILGFIPFEN